MNGGSDRGPKVDARVSGGSDILVSRPPEGLRSDEKLAGRACGGDAAAFGELAERHTTALRRTLYKITRDCEQAQDASQEALARAWRSVCSFEGRSKFSTWLTRIGINEAYRALGKSQRETCLDCEGGPADRLVDSAPRPDRVAESRAELAAVGEALDALPDGYREAVVLRDVEGLSTREAAASAGIGERALKSRLHRGRRAMLDRLDGDILASH